MAKHLAGNETMLSHMRRNPDAFRRGLETLTESILRFIDAARATGIAGIYYAVQHAAYPLMSHDARRGKATTHCGQARPPCAAASPPTKAAISHQRLGVFCVGSWVVISILSALFGMPDTRVAVQAISRFVAADVVHFGRNGPVTIETGTLGYISIERRYLNRLRKIAERECGAVAESIQSLHRILGDD